MNWRLCPKYHKLTNIDDLNPFQGSLYTAFGTACHEMIENSLSRESSDRKFEYNPDVAFELFQKAYQKELKELWDHEKELDEDFTPDMKLASAMEQAAERVAKDWHPELQEYLPNYEYVQVEHEFIIPIHQKIDGHEYAFKGFIDFVAKKDDEYHLFDWKTCSWGWDAKKKGGIAKTYQLVLYKHFYAKELGLDPKKVRCHFGLLKRSPGKGKSVELFEVKAGPRKITNALNLVHEALLNIHKGQFLPNYQGCKHPDRYGICPFVNSEHCSKVML